MDSSEEWGEFDLDNLVQVKDVQVVQSVDAGALKWILSRLQKADAAQDERIASLEKANEALMDQLQRLQSEVAQQAQSTDPFSGIEGDDFNKGGGQMGGVQVIKELPKRVKALELALNLGAGGVQPHGVEYEAATTGQDEDKLQEPHARTSHQGSPDGSAADGAAVQSEGRGGEGQDGLHKGPAAAGVYVKHEGGSADGSAEPGRGYDSAGKARSSQKPMTLPEVQQKVEELEAKLEEAEKTLQAATKATEAATSKAKEAAQAAENAAQGRTPTGPSGSWGGADAPGASQQDHEGEAPGAAGAVGTVGETGGAGAAGAAGADGGAGAAGRDGAAGVAGREGAAGGSGRDGLAGGAGRDGGTGAAGAAGAAGVAGKDGAAGSVRVLHLNGDGSVDPIQLIKVINEGSADVARLRMLVLELQDKQQQMALDSSLGLPHDSYSEAGKQGFHPAGAAVHTPAAGADGGGAAGTDEHGQAEVEVKGNAQNADPAAGAAAPGGPLDKSRRGKGTKADAAKAAAALDEVQTLEGALPFIKDLYDLVSGKAERQPFEDLLRRVSYLAIAIENVEKDRAAKQQSVEEKPHSEVTRSKPECQAAPEQGPAPATNEPVLYEPGDDDPLTISARLKMLMNKVGDLSFTVMALQSSAARMVGHGQAAGAAGEEAAAKAQHDAELEQRVEQMELQLASKAEQAALDTLKLQLALQGGGHRGTPIIQRDFQYLDSTQQQDSEVAQEQEQAGRKGRESSIGGDGGDVAGNIEGDGVGVGEGEGADEAGAGGARRSGAGRSSDGRAGSTGQGGMEGLLPMLEGLLADKASKAELAALQSAFGQRPDYKLDIRNAVLEAKRAADAAAVARADTASQADELARMQRLLSGLASREEVGALAQQVGDMLNNLMELRTQVTHLPRDHEPFSLSSEDQQQRQSKMGQPASSSLGQTLVALGSGKGGDADTVLKMINALAKELEAMKHNMDMLAHASNIMAVGMEVVIVQPNPQQPGGLSHPSPHGLTQVDKGSSDNLAGAEAGSGGVGFALGKHEPGGNASYDGNTAAARGAGAGADTTAAVGLVNGKEPANHRGAMSRLIKMLGGQTLQHKMDWFDPGVLNRVAQRLGTVDALLKSPLLMQGAKGSMGGAATPNGQDVEIQMRRLTKEIKLLKENQAAPPTFTGGFKDNSSGEYAMLAGKPIMGYRCMACDRPLDKLDDRPGPYIPTAQMPLKMPSGLSQAGMPNMRVPNSTASSLSPEPSQQKVPGGTRKAGPTDPDRRGPQHWYNESHEAAGRAAENLPAQDVGPKLPPGGWRGNSASLQLAPNTKSSLPDIGQPRRTTSPPRSSPQVPSSPHMLAPVNAPRQKPEGEVPMALDHAQMQQSMLPSL